MVRTDASRSIERGARGSAAISQGVPSDVVEAFGETGAHVHYDDEGLEFIEVFSPCRPGYAGVDLLGAQAVEVVEKLVQLGLTVRDDGQGGLWFDDHGFALYAPDDESEGVSVFRRGQPTGA